MNLADRFVCRREGHVPAVVLTRATGLRVESYLTTCRRCGRVFEVPATPSTYGTSGGRTA